MRQIDFLYADGDKYRVSISQKMVQALREKLWLELQSKAVGISPKDIDEISDIIEDLKELDEMLRGHYINVTEEDLKQIEDELFPPKESR